VRVRPPGEEQIIAVLKESEAWATTKELCAKCGISEPTFYTWKTTYVGMKVHVGCTLSANAVGSPGERREDD
jgi:putative transposase